MSRCRLTGLIHRLLPWGIVALLTACSPVGPDYQLPAMSLPRDWRNAEVQTHSADGRTVALWWGLFQDRQLSTLITEAITINPDLAIAETRIREARAQARLADADLQPSVDLGSSATNSRKSENIPSGGVEQNLFVLDFDAAWEVDIFGGSRRQSEAAAATVQATIEDYRDVLVSLTAEVAKNYIDLRAAQNRLRIARKNIELQNQTLQLTRDRFATGLGNALEVAQAQTQLALLQAQIPPLESSAAKSHHQLALLLARQVQDRNWLGEAPLPLPPLNLPLLLPSELTRQRPDIRSVERQLATANAEVGVATADLFPRFSLAALGGMQSTDLHQLITSGSRYWSLGPTIQWSLFDGGRRRATLAASEARLDRARHAYEKTVLNALVEVEDALVEFERENAARRQLQQAVLSSRTATKISQYQYTAGLNTFLNVLVAETTLAQAEDKLIQSEQRLSLAMIALYKALGGGWQQAGTAGEMTHPSRKISQTTVPAHP